MTGKLTIQTLGGLSIKLDGTAVSGFVSRKAEALLVYLACNPRLHTRDTLATLLWDDLPQQRSLGNLSVLLSSLRKQLSSYLDISRHEIGINRESNYWVDAVALADHLRTRPRRSELTRSTAVRQAHAVALYQGDFLSGFHIRQATDFSEWLVFEQERLQQLAIGGMDRLVSFYLQRQKYNDGINLAVQLVNLDPLREESHRQLMRLMTMSGRRNAALEQYHACRKILEEELGVAPAADTTGLYEQIKAGLLQPKPAANQTDARPLTLEPDLPNHNLPADSTSFVGREQELALMKRRLGDPACRLLTVVGPGGVGKTRLVLAAAQQQVGQFLDGVWVTSLTSLSSPEFLETAVANALGFSFSGSKEARLQLMDYLRQKELLLVLDGFEHVISAHSISFVNTILAQAAETQLLISSRERLNVQAEWLLEVAGLPYPPGSATPSILEYGAVQLFNQRAQQVSPAFDVAAQTPAVTDIVRMVAGIPLGIELAAANVRYYACTEVAEGIQESIDFLQTNQRDMPARHRSLRAVMDRSWQTLTPVEQAAFAALSVFRGHFSQPAAQEVLKTALPVLHSLVDKSLLQRHEDGRFQLHDILRQYAAEKLQAMPNQPQKAQNRHGAVYAKFLQRWHASIKSGQQFEALEAIQAEVENIRIGWQYAQLLDRRTPDLIPLLSSALDALFYFYNIRSWFREGFAMFNRAVAWLSPPESEAERILLARLRARYGWFGFLLGERALGETALRESLTILEETDYAEDIIFCRNYLGAIAYYGQDYDQAKMFLEQALALAQAAADWYGEAICLNIMGVLHIAQMDYETAAMRLRASLALKRDNGDLWGMAFSLEKLGDVEMAFSRFAEAEANYRESLSIRRRLRDRRGVALCLQQLGDLAASQGDEETAVQLYTECLQIFAEIGDVQSMDVVRDKLKSGGIEIGD